MKNTLFISIVLLAGTAWAENYGGGSGTLEDPYQIWTPKQMNTIGLNTDDWNKHFILMSNIDISAYTGTEYNIIGNSTMQFTGMFDGKIHMAVRLNKKVMNLCYSQRQSMKKCS